MTTPLLEGSPFSQGGFTCTPTTWSLGYTDGATQYPGISATIGGSSAGAACTLSLSTTPQAAVDQSYRPNQSNPLMQWYIHIGQDLGMSGEVVGTGMSAKFQVQTPDLPFSVGTIAFEQLVDRANDTYTAAGTGLTGIGLAIPAPALDGQLLDFWCGDPTAAAPRNSLSAYVGPYGDAPANALDSSYTSFTENDYFSDYFLYKPTSPSIWVTVAEYDWTFSATATSTGQGGWVKSSDTSANMRAWYNSSLLPQWSALTPYKASCSGSAS